MINEPDASHSQITSGLYLGPERGTSTPSNHLGFFLIQDSRKTPRENQTTRFYLEYSVNESKLTYSADLLFSPKQYPHAGELTKKVLHKQTKNDGSIEMK